MGWPVSQDYNEAVQNPGTVFGDPELRAGEPVFNALGLPMPRSGNFADVYEVVTPATKRKWAVKCFTREVPGLRERYREISNYLRQAHLPFMVDFNYLDEGIRIRGRWYPVLKMHWVEGLTLNEFVKMAVDKPQTLELLVQVWGRLARRLRETRMAHCDLQHGNVLLVPGSKAKSLKVKLIDYDGMCVPALAQRKSGELGHPAFQHPQRIREGTYGPEVDRFPHLVITCALQSLVRGGRGLWDRYDNGDNLLFRQKDLENPENSPLFQELLRSGDPLVRSLAEILSRAARQRLDQVPLLEELPGAQPAGTGAVIQEKLRRVTRVIAAARTKKTRRLVWAGVGGALVLLVAVVVALARKGGEAVRKEPAEAQTKSGDSFGAFLGHAFPKPDARSQPTATPEAVPVVPVKPDAVPPKPDPGPVVGPMPKPEVQPQPPTGKLLRVPDRAEQDEIRKGFIEPLYPAAYQKRQTAEMRAAAGAMLQNAAGINADNAHRFVLLHEACDLAADALDLPTAFKAIDQMARFYEVDALQMKAAALIRAGPAMTTEAEAKVVIDGYFSLADEAVAANRYDLALQVLKRAEDMVSVKRPEMVAQIKARSEKVKEQQK